jgi:hypothetical protein
MRALALALACSFLGATGAAFAHSVPQVQTTKFLAPESLALIKARAAAGQKVQVQGDILSYIIQFSPIENSATVGAGGYVTDYIPAGVEVVGAWIVDIDGQGGFRPVPPNLPGPCPNGWTRRQHNWTGAPFSSNAYDPSGQCSAAAMPDGKCNSSMAMTYADTGIFYSNDPRTALFASGDLNVKQGTNGYNVSPTGEGQVNSLLGQSNATTHNLWDADQTNAFGSTASAITGTPSPKSAAPSLESGSSDAGKGVAPFGAGSAVAGP